MNNDKDFKSSESDWENSHVDESLTSIAQIGEATGGTLDALEDAILSKEAIRLKEQRMRRINDAFHSVVNGAPIQDSLHILSDLAVAETFGYGRTAFYQLNADGSELHIIRGAGNMPDAYVEQIDGILMGKDSLAHELAVAISNSALTEDVLNEPLWKPWVQIAAQFSYRACWSFPIKTKEDKVVGTLAIYFEDPRKATSKDIELAEQITHAAAVILAYHNEMDKRYRAEQLLIKNEPHVPDARKVARLGISVIDADGGIIVANEEMKRFLPTMHIPSQHDDQNSRWKAFHDNGKEANVNDFPGLRLFTGEAVLPGIDMLYTNDDGSEIWTHVASLPIKDSNDKVVQVVLVILDIDELKRSAEQLQKFNTELEKKVAERTKQLEESADKIASLNSSLVASNRELSSANNELKSFATIAANKYSETLRHLYINLELIVTNDARNLSNSGRANLRRAQGAIQKMKLTTDDLISFFKLHEIGVKENNVDLNVIIEKVVEDFRRQPAHSAVAVNCDALPLIDGYPSLLALLFHHLMDNSVKFRKRDVGHIINIKCRDSVRGEQMSNEAAEKNITYHVISIEDNGIGFPETESEQIFKMFYRLHDKSRYKGSGIGLALCRKIMEMHGGFITAEGKPDVSASFHCYFPA